MSLKSTFGLDGVELGIHVVVTAIVVGFAASFNRPDEARAFAALTLVGSLVLLSIRRGLALRKVEQPKGLSTGEMAAERLAELEERIAEVEAGQARLAELEERLDFAERLLARPPEQRALQPERES